MVDAVRGDGVVDIGYGHHAPVFGNFFPFEAFWIAAAIEFFVVLGCRDDRDFANALGAGKNIPGVAGMQLHHL
tara:strand:- start:408 stop:626 length:219 start_codon:yes stop_codon:yes gene_type:complete